MSRKLTPTGQSRIFGARNIKRMLETQKADPARDAHTSIADKPHASNREADRRRRQAERRAANNAM